MRLLSKCSFTTRLDHTPQVESRVQQTGDNLKRYLGLRNQSVTSLQGFATSVFAAQAPDSGGFTVDSLLNFQAGEADQAAAVKAAIARLTSGGLSGSLLKQLQNQGAAGIQQILTLSTATDQQIALFNQLNRQTQNRYGAAGLNIGNTFYGADIKDARAEDRLANKISRALHEAIKDDRANYEGASVSHRVRIECDGPFGPCPPSEYVVNFDDFRESLAKSQGSLKDVTTALEKVAARLPDPRLPVRVEIERDDTQ